MQIVFGGVAFPVIIYGMDATTLVIWIADLSRDDGRRDALRDGNQLTALALQQGLVASDSNGADEIARAFAEAHGDGWITYDYASWPNDPDPPAKFAFQHQHLQRCQNIRIARDAWSAIPALRAESSPPPTGAPEESGSAESEPHGGPERDIFICHAGEDKDTVARPLAEQLISRGWRVWFDEFEIKVGDGLRSKIDEGLAISRFGAVILSPAFLAKKKWTEHELDGLVTRESKPGQKVILPIWHQVGHDEVASYSAPLANRKAAETDHGLDQVVGELEKVLKGSDARSDVPAKGSVAEAGERAKSAPRRDSAESDGTLGWRLSRDEFRSEVIGALRSDEISILLFIEGLPGEAARLLNSDGADDELPQLLDSAACLAAILLTLDRDTLVERCVGQLFSIYSRGLDQNGIALSGLRPPAPQLWLWILRRLFGLGALAVRRERWDLVRGLVARRGEGYEFGYYANWLRHGLTMAARSGLLEQQEEGRRVHISLLGLAAEDINRLECLRPDLPPDDEAIITSLCRFDFLACLVGVDAVGEVDGRAFYPNFSGWYSSRVEPVIVRLLGDDAMRRAVFKGDDRALAAALRGLNEQARQEAFTGGGWMGYESQKVLEFLHANPDD